MTEQAEKLSDWIFASGQFDATWYRNAFPDVDALGMDPRTHYRRYGSLMARAPNAAFVADPEQLAALLLPAPEEGRELLAAHEVALTGAHDRAVHYARQHLPANLNHTLNILQANQAVANGDMAGWLNHANDYLSHFGVAPLHVGHGGGRLMDRLATAPVAPVEDGPLVSVIMPAWNTEKTIGHAVRSILAQSWRNLELLIVDDASEDGTWQMIRQFAAADARVRIFRNSVNVGPYVSKNIAVSQARGEWITGQDSDDWAHPERLERQVRFCQQQNSQVCMSGTLRMAEDGQFVRLNPIGRLVHDGACRSALISLMMSSQYFHDLLGYWDPVRIAGDSEILHRIECLRGSPVPQDAVPTLLMLDNPEGLTNHPTLGHSETNGISPHRRTYRRNYRAAHTALDKFNSRFDFPMSRRRFPAPEEMLNPDGRIEEAVQAYKADGINPVRDINVDIALVTTLCWSGGNASSSLDEIAFFSRQGLSFAVIHCPIDQNLGRRLSGRFAPWSDSVTNWSRLGRLSAKVLICRHPAVVSSHAFRHVSPRITADQTFIVVNNSHLRATGRPVYDRGAMVAAARGLDTGKLTFCPISPAIRGELQEHARKAGDDLPLSDSDWTPTFDLSLYHHAPKERMERPWRIGRHGRDGAEKWHEDPRVLRQIYPEGGDFRIFVLGGAKKASKTLGGLPANWIVHGFGEIEPHEYLRNLDAFVYYPDSRLVEGFGRTIVEAMLAGVPVILPHSFEPTFGNLPFYAMPRQVAPIVQALARDDSGRIRYLTEVQNIAIQRYSTSVIATRLAATGLDLRKPETEVLTLSTEARTFQRKIQDAGRS